MNDDFNTPVLIAHLFDGVKIINSVKAEKQSLSSKTVKNDELIDCLLKANKNILIWPGICPHEGAELKKDYFKDQKLICPWHNLSFPPLILSSSEPQLEILGLNITLSDKTLTIFNKRS